VPNARPGFLQQQPSMHRLQYYIITRSCSLANALQKIPGHPTSCVRRSLFPPPAHTWVSNRISRFRPRDVPSNLIGDKCVGIFQTFQYYIPLQHLVKRH